MTVSFECVRGLFSSKPLRRPIRTTDRFIANLRRVAEAMKKRRAAAEPRHTGRGKRKRGKKWSE